MLIGGVVYQYSYKVYGLSMVLWVAAPFLLVAGVIGAFLNGAQWGPGGAADLARQALIDADPHATVDDIAQLQLTESGAHQSQAI